VCAGGPCFVSVIEPASRHRGFFQPDGQAMVRHRYCRWRRGVASFGPQGQAQLIIAAGRPVRHHRRRSVTWFKFFEATAKRCTPRPRRREAAIFIDVPKCWSTWSARPASACNISGQDRARGQRGKAVEAIKPSMPRVTDLFQTYLPRAAAADLTGSVGLFRLKES